MSSRDPGRLSAPLTLGVALLIMSLPAQAVTKPATAQPADVHADVATQSAVYVERVQADSTRRLEPANHLRRGDRVVTVVDWYRLGGGDSFVITNPLPSALAYQASAWDDQDVSVDGGRTWGRLEALHIGRRSATSEDVTHVRWRISARDRRRGQIAYSGIVR